MMLSLLAAGAKVDYFIDWLVLGFGVDRVNSSVMIERLVSFLSRLPLRGSAWVLQVAGCFLWLECP